MDITSTMKNFWGKSKYWWMMLVLGIVVFAIGLWIMLQPNVGYLIVAVALGYALLVGGILQLIISASLRKESKGWGWWMAGGILDILIGFLLIANPMFTEALLPFFFGFVFLYKGVTSLVSAFSMLSDHKYWWLYLINGILTIVLACLFFIFPFSGAVAIIFLSSFMMLYWGISLIAISFDIKPTKTKTAKTAR